MERYEVGMLARSKAGHDKGHVYVIFEVDEAYVYLVDGSIRTIDKPKKKKKKQQSILEKEIMSIMSKSMKAALDMALDDLLKDWK